MARIVVVTGAASGIGRALAGALVAAGDSVVIADIDGEAAERAAHELACRGPGAATAAAVDVRDAAAVRTLIHQTRGRHGRLDVLVNNAGVGVAAAAEQFALAHWDRVIDVNLRGVVHGVHAVHPPPEPPGFLPCPAACRAGRSPSSRHAPQSPLPQPSCSDGRWHPDGT